MQKMKMFFKKYYGLFFLAAAIVMVAVIVQVGDAIRERREKYLREHPESKWKDGMMITVYKNDEAVLTTPCGSCVFTNTDSKNMMRIEWHRECGFGQADEVTTIPMETGIIYRAKKEPCKIKK